MNKKIYTVLCLALAFFVTSCDREVKSAVTTFHQLPLPRGETIRIVPLDINKWGSLEFKNYADRIATELRNIGYTPVGREDDAELIAEIDYKIDMEKTEILHHPSAYVRYTFVYGHFHRPYYRGYFDYWDPVYYSETVYTRTLAMNIVKTLGRQGEGRTVLFEGRVSSTGREDKLHLIMPYLITAMFTNFPGESGITKIVTIERED